MFGNIVAFTSLEVSSISNANLTVPGTITSLLLRLGTSYG